MFCNCVIHLNWNLESCHVIPLVSRTGAALRSNRSGRIPPLRSLSSVCWLGDLRRPPATGDYSDWQSTTKTWTRFPSISCGQLQWLGFNCSVLHTSEFITRSTTPSVSEVSISSELLRESIYTISIHNVNLTYQHDVFLIVPGMTTQSRDLFLDECAIVVIFLKDGLVAMYTNDMPGKRYECGDLIQRARSSRVADEAVVVLGFGGKYGWFAAFFFGVSDNLMRGEVVSVNSTFYSRIRGGSKARCTDLFQETV